MMSAAAVTPRIRLMAVCDGVRESKTESGVYHPRGVRHSIVADGFPHVPARLRLFLHLSSPRPGMHPGYVRVVNDRTDKAIFHGNLTPTPAFDGDHAIRAASIGLGGAFQEEGGYTVQVWFFQDQGNDVLKGEASFSVVSEDT